MNYAMGLDAASERLLTGDFVLTYSGVPVGRIIPLDVPAPLLTIA